MHLRAYSVGMLRLNDILFLFESVCICQVVDFIAVRCPGVTLKGKDL